MQLTSNKSVPASVDDTYAALTDAEVLKDCIPGCESITRSDDGRFLVSLLAKVGPVSARFNGTMNIVDPTPPTAYTLVFEGKGGPAGFAKGSADVKLSPEGAAKTLMAYSVKADVGGKLAQVGARLIQSAAQKVADEFFGAFIAKMQSRASTPGAGDESSSSDAAVPKGGAPSSVLAGLAGWQIASLGAGVVVLALILWALAR